MGRNQTPILPPWHIVHSESSEGLGGQERRVLTELAGFRGRGHRVSLIAPPTSRILAEARRLGIPVLPLSFGKLAFGISMMRAARWLRRERAQIVNPHSSRDGWLIGMAARQAGVPLLIRSRHFDVPVKNPWFSKLAYRTLADHVITTSPVVTEKFKHLFGLDDHGISTISTGIDLERFSPRTPAAALPLERRPRIGMVAVLRLAKGHIHLLQAVARLKREGLHGSCVIVGEGPQRQNVIDEIHRLQLQDDVALLGHREDVPEILRALDVLVLPSLHEAIPQVLMQALAAGVPVVASNVGGIPSVIRPGETGRLVPPGDSDALAVAIRETVEQPEASQRMSREGRKRVEQHHGIDTMLDLTERIYRRHLLGTVDGVGKPG